MPRYFPLFFDLEGHRCLVVGGGPIGERKTRALRDCGARVTLVSPVVTNGLAVLAAAGRLEHRARTFRTSDVRGCRLVVAATGGPDDRAVVAAARRRGVLVNAVDRPAWCDVIVPSVLQRGELQIAVSTGGRSPALARDIRRRLEPLFAPEFGEVVERAGRERADGLARAGTPKARVEAGERAARRALAAVTSARDLAQQDQRTRKDEGDGERREGEAQASRRRIDRARDRQDEQPQHVDERRPADRVLALPERAVHEQRRRDEHRNAAEQPARRPPEPGTVAHRPDAPGFATSGTTLRAMEPSSAS